jgi:Tol biopolymer transport system component
MTSRRTSRDDFDRLMGQWLEADAHVRSPEHLLDGVLERTKGSRRIPRWLLPERWIPVQLTMPLRAVPRPIPLLLLLTALLLGYVTYLADGQIYASNPDGSNAIPLTSGSRSAATPSWSRDGTRFAFKLVSPRPGTDDPTKFGDIVVANADGSHLITIDRETEDPSPPTWSADDRWLVYSKSVGDCGRSYCDQIFIAAADGSSPPMQIGNPDSTNWAPIFSPDGTKILYHVDTHHVAVMNRDGSNDHLLNTTTFTDLDSAQWHPDGDRVVVSARTTGGFDLWTLHVDGGLEQQLHGAGRDKVGPSWSPDGSRLAYLQSIGGQTFELVVANEDGTNERTLPGAYSHINPAWSPDAGLIAVVNDLGSVGRVTLVDPDGVAEPITIEGDLPAATDVAIRSSPTSWQRIAP